MKRIAPSSNAIYESVTDARVFLGDLLGLVQLLQGEGLRVEVRSGDIVFDNLDELRQHHGDRAKEITILAWEKSRESESVSIEISRDTLGGPRASVRLYPSKDLGLATHRILEEVRKFHFRHAVWLRSWPWWALAVTCFLLEGQVGPVNASAGKALDLASLVMYGMALVVSVLRRRMLGIHLRFRHQGGYLRRNADAIGLVILGAVAGTVLTILSQWLLKTP